MTRTPSAALFLLACTLSATLLGACGSTGTKAGEPVEIRYLNYLAKPRVELALVNPAHSDRAELYSATRKLEESGTKVSTDEVIAETLRYFHEQGFDDKVSPGAAPGEGGGVYSQALEIETPSRHVHMVFHRGLSKEDQTMFLECVKAFADVYNSTYQLQSVDRMPDWEGGSKKSPSGVAPAPKSTDPKKSQG